MCRLEVCRACILCSCSFSFACTLSPPRFSLDPTSPPPPPTTTSTTRFLCPRPPAVRYLDRQQFFLLRSSLPPPAAPPTATPSRSAPSPPFAFRVPPLLSCCGKRLALLDHMPPLLRFLICLDSPAADLHADSLLLPLLP